MKKIFNAFLKATLILACSAVYSQTSTIKVGILNGPSGIPCAYLMENKNQLEKSVGKSFEFTNFASAQQELPALLKNEISIGFLPPNAAAKVFNSSNKAVVMLGICGNGNLFIISKDSTYKSLETLKGKKIVCAGQGATPEYMLKYLLSKKGIETGEGSDKVELDFSIPNASIAAAVISGKADYALVPEPFASVALLKDASVKRVADISKVFADEESGSTFPMTLLVANSKFASENKFFVNKFVNEYKKAVEWTLKNQKKAGSLAEKHNFGLKADIAAAAIPNGAYVWKDASYSKADIEKLLNIFLSFAPEAAGGKLPENDFYYMK